MLWFCVSDFVGVVVLEWGDVVFFFFEGMVVIFGGSCGGIFIRFLVFWGWLVVGGGL